MAYIYSGGQTRHIYINLSPWTPEEICVKFNLDDKSSLGAEGWEWKFLFWVKHWMPDRGPIPLKNMGTLVTLLVSLLSYSNLWEHGPLQTKWLGTFLIILPPFFNLTSAVWSKFGDPSLKGSRVIVQTSDWLTQMDGHRHRQQQYHYPKATIDLR